MVTFFTTAKPFREHIGIIQRNALKSWTLLHREAEVILFGDDEGAADAARDIGIRHKPHVDRNEFGSKRLDYLFGKAQAIGRHDVLCYINCDILLMRDFCQALEHVKEAHAKFLMVGRRWDLQIDEPYDFERNDWEARLRTITLKQGKRRKSEWIDYFVFSRGLYGADVPPFVIGRVFWDNWLVWKAGNEKYSVVDVSDVVLAVHQNHDYGYHPQGKAGVFFGEESGRNHKLAGGWKHLRTIADASEKLRADGLKPNWMRHWTKAKRYIRQTGRVLLYGVLQRAWFLVLGLTRPLRSTLRLRAEDLRHIRNKV